jgi:hypothetical protein
MRIRIEQSTIEGRRSNRTTTIQWAASNQELSQFERCQYCPLAIETTGVEGIVVQVHSNIKAEALCYSIINLRNGMESILESSHSRLNCVRGGVR